MDLETQKGGKIVIVSGYFNPLHCGHLDLIDAAAKIGKVIVIVNNDNQQILKKGKVIIDEGSRMRIVKALRKVDEVVLSIDQDSTVCATLEMLAEKYSSSNYDVIFANGGDRDTLKNIPEAEVCNMNGIEVVFGVGSEEVIKRDTSTRINKELGVE